MEEIKQLQYQEIKKMISSVPWENYKTVYGNAAEDRPYTIIGGGEGVTPKIETLLFDLFGEDHKAALKASHGLWDELCHQAQVSSSALPAYDIFVSGLEILNDQLKEEVLDILYNMIGGIPKTEPAGSWRSQLRMKFKRDEAVFHRLKADGNEGIASFAELILDQL